MAAEIDAAAAAAPPPGAPRAGRARAAQGGRPRARRGQPGGAGGQRRGPRAARRPRCASSCAPPASRWPRRSWARACCSPDSPKALGSVGLQSGDYRWRASTRPTWCSPSATTWSSTRPSTGTRGATRRSSASTRCRPRSTRTSCPRSSWWATSTTSSPGSARSAATCPTRAARRELRDLVLGRFEQAADDDGFPVQPPRALCEIRQALGREDILISDVGLHKLWIARMFPAYEPNTVLIANGLAGMGFALPAAVAAKLVHPERNVVTVNGDGGFLMNCQELETAVRLKTPFVNVIWENQPVRLDRLEAGQEVRHPLRHRLHEPRLRQAGRELRHAGLALRVRRRVRGRAGGLREGDDDGAPEGGAVVVALAGHPGDRHPGPALLLREVDEQRRLAVAGRRAGEQDVGPDVAHGASVAGSTSRRGRSTTRSSRRGTDTLGRGTAVAVRRPATPRA